MPHDVTMPQLGMAQDAGKIVAWLKAPGDPVTKGDALFEVETDKATMEVEAQEGGFLTAVTAAEGEDVPVGAVIARISDSAEDDAGPDAPAAVTGSDTPPASAPTSGADDLPEGTSVTMPQLGMAQDSGLLVTWLKSPGDPVAVDDLLFEVETDKSTMEVPAGQDGYLLATLAEAGEEVPVGEAVAIIGDSEPEAPIARARGAAAAAAPKAEADPAPAPAETSPKPAREQSKPAPAPRAVGGRILASPKARRIAREQGLDLNRLAKAGHPQPFHVRDLDSLRALPDTAAGSQAGSQAATRSLTAKVATDGFAAFAGWAKEAHGLTDADALLAGLAGANLPAPCTVAVTRLGQTRQFAVPPGRALSRVEPVSATPEETPSSPDLVLRDLRGGSIRAVAMGGEDHPVLTVMSDDTGLTLTLETSPNQMDADAAITLLTNFADCMEQPLQHLL